MADLGSGRGWLNDAPAASIRRIDRALGHPMQITEAGRTWAQQNVHWLNYQRNGSPIALHPDTPSVHQKGAAIDTDEGQRHVQLLAGHGWKRTVYRNGKLVEPWHFEYFPDQDLHRNEPVFAGLETPAPPVPEEDDMIALLIDGKHKCTLAPGVFSHMIQADNPDRIKNIVRSDDDWTETTLTELPVLLSRYGCDLHIWDVRGGKFVVVNPLDNSVREGNTWSVWNAIRSTVAAVKVTSEQTKAYVEKLAKEA